ncbi:MAG: hypothetical protein WA324_25985 [Bryobacteraceae bacterium]
MIRSSFWLVAVYLVSISSGVAAHASPLRTIPARDVERELLVPVRIQDQGPFWFALDTGIAHSVIDGNMIKDLRLEVREQDPKHKVTPAILLDVGGLNFEAPLDVLDIGAAEYQRGYDQPLVGLLGMDFFSKFCVTLDYDAQVVTIEDPSVNVQPAGTKSIPLTVRDSLPYFEATIKVPGHSAIRRFFMLDTSTGDALNDDAFAHLDRAAIGPDLGRAEFFVIGSYRFRGINGTSGSSKVGGELLHRFRVTIDVSHNRLFLEPSRHFGDSFLFDTSGLDLERSEDGLKILRVFPRTPGQEAGLLSGDVITSIDGESAGAFTVPQVRLMFHEVGSHNLLVDSKGEHKSVELKLRTLL